MAERRSRPVFGPRARVEGANGTLELEEVEGGLAFEHLDTGDEFTLNDAEVRVLHERLSDYLRHRQLVRSSAAYRSMWPYVKP